VGTSGRVPGDTGGVVLENVRGEAGEEADERVHPLDVLLILALEVLKGSIREASTVE